TRRSSDLTRDPLGLAPAVAGLRGRQDPIARTIGVAAQHSPDPVDVDDGDADLVAGHPWLTIRRSPTSRGCAAGRRRSRVPPPPRRRTAAVAGWSRWARAPRSSPARTARPARSDRSPRPP